MTVLVILNYNNYEDTFNCIESVDKFNTAEIKIIVVDNGSTREGASTKIAEYLMQRYSNRYLHLNDNEALSMKGLKRVLPYCTYIESSTNDGYARGNNKALYLTECDDTIENVMILNNDVLFVQDIIPSLCKQYDSLHDAAILSPILYKRNMDGLDMNCARKNTTFKAEVMENFFHYIFVLLGKTNPYLKQRYLINDEKQLPLLLKIELPSGSCMFIKKSLFASIGFFDPNTFLYYEENILHKKTEKLGLNNYLVTNLKCIHLGAQSTSNSPSIFGIMCGAKSGRYYMKNYAGITIWQYWIYLFSQYVSLANFRLQKNIWKFIGKK